MRNVFKPFGARATSSSSDQFSRSRWILTGVYVLILGSVLLVSGGVSRLIFINQVEERFHRFDVYIQNQRPFFVERIDFAPTPLNQRALRKDFEESMMLVNGALLVLGGLLSYWLAGITLRPIERAYTSQRRFVADASHELRTPIAILRLRLEERTRAEQRPELRNDLQEDLEEVDAMTKLVNDLLEMAKMQDHLEERQQEFVDIREVAQNVARRMEVIATNAEVQLNYQSEEKQLLLAAVRSQESLERAIANIIKNAITYSPKNGEVLVQVKKAGENVLISIQDQGPGIPDTEKKSIFERFYRIDKSRSKNTPGTGLGLSIAQEIITDMQGTIHIEDAPNTGALVVITIPIHKAS